MEEKRVVGLCILHQPVHCSKNVCLGGLAHRVLLVIGKQNHILAGVSEVLVEVGRHVLDVVDAPAQLSSLLKIVDTDQKCFASTGAGRVLKSVAVGRSMAESLFLLWRRRWSSVSYEIDQKVFTNRPEIY